MCVCWLVGWLVISNLKIIALISFTFNECMGRFKKSKIVLKSKVDKGKNTISISEKIIRVMKV